MFPFSPEQAMAKTMLADLVGPLSKLNPMEYEASCHINMSGNWDEDRAFVELAYYDSPNEDSLDTVFEDLIETFDESFTTLAPLLCEKWGIEDPDDILWPIDDTQHIATYYTEADFADYELRITSWQQPQPDSETPLGVIAVYAESYAPQLSGFRLFYLDGTLLAGRTIDSMHEGSPQDAWNAGYELTPDDVMLLQRLVHSIELKKFDTRT